MAFDCRDVQGLASNYLDGELPEEMGDRIQRHLLRCAACREEIDTLRMTVEVLRSAHPQVALSEPASRSMLDTLRAELDIATDLPEAPGQLVLGIGSPR